jgi:1,4-dihydroxy-2-naphthoate octaprenyltransferase
MPSRQANSGRPPLWKVWFIAARPHTLTASIAPNIVSYHAGIAHIPNLESRAGFLSLTIQWTLFCVLVQLGTNLHNDYADFVRGADNEKRVGQARATQRGWLTPGQTATASGLTLTGALLLGLSFLYRMVRAGVPQTDAGPELMALMVVIVVSSVFNAFAYTGGPWPLGYIGLPTLSIGYSGLGDVFVFLYFGLVATLVAPILYVVCSNTTWTSDEDATAMMYRLLGTLAPYAVQVAALATNIIIVNNLRDRHTDVLAAKRTLAVRFGATFCRVEYGVMLLVAYGLTVYDYLALPSGPLNHRSSVVRLLPLLSIPLAWKEWRAICRKEGSALNQHVGGSAMVQFLFCILLATAIWLSSSR